MMSSIFLIFNRFVFDIDIANLQCFPDRNSDTSVSICVLLLILSKIIPLQLPNLTISRRSSPVCVPRVALTVTPPADNVPTAASAQLIEFGPMITTLSPGLTPIPTKYLPINVAFS